MGKRVTKVTLDVVREFAKTYLRSLPRDKQLLGARFVWKYRDEPKMIYDMGFIQYLESELEKT